MTRVEAMQHPADVPLAELIKIVNQAEHTESLNSQPKTGEVYFWGKARVVFDRYQTTIVGRK